MTIAFARLATRSRPPDFSFMRQAAGLGSSGNWLFPALASNVVAAHVEVSVCLTYRDRCSLGSYHSRSLALDLSDCTSSNLMRRSNRLLHSRISSQFVCSASSQAAHSPLHAALQQAMPLAATRAPSNGRYQPVPGWLATLAVGGFAAGIVATNLEEVPLTGRKQLQINWMQPEAKDHGMIPKLGLLMPVCADRPIYTVIQNRQLCQQGGDLLRSIYARAAFSTDVLAHQHPKLRARLSTLPDTADLVFHVDQLSAEASFAGGNACAWYNFWCIFNTKPQFVVSLSAGELLQHCSYNSLVWVMGHEFGHGIAKHASEMDSWALVATSAILSRLALSSIALFPAIALGCVLSTVTRHVVIGRWLSQRLEHEADVTGTAIATAAGCSSEDILCAMSCCQIAPQAVAELMLQQSPIPLHQQKALASLKSLMPHGQLPRTILDSRDIHMIQDTIATQLSTASDETLQKAGKHVLELEMSLAQSLVYLKNPLESWVSTHPHWLDRIAYVKASEYFGGAHVAKPIMSEVEAARMLEFHNHYGGQAMLHAYQASSEWPTFIASLDRDVPDGLAIVMYSLRFAERSLGPGNMLFWMEAQAARQYDTRTVLSSVVSALVSPPDGKP